MRRLTSAPENPDTSGWSADSAQRPPLPWLPVVVAALAIVMLCAAGVYDTMGRQEERELARLRAVADLKAGLLVSWLRERRDDAGYLAGARHLAVAYQGWQGRANAADGELLRRELGDYLRHNGFSGAQLIDARTGRAIWDSQNPHAAVAPAVRAAAGRALAGRGPVQVGPYSDAGRRLRLDFVVALPQVGAAASPLVVLRADLRSGLFPILQAWPGPVASGEVVWFRRDGGDVLFLSGSRDRSGAVLRLPMAGSALLAAQLLRGEARPGQALKGVDYRGEPVFGVAHAVPGSDWFVLAKLDQSELYAEAYRDAVWIVLSGLLALFMTAAGTWLARQRRELALAKRTRQVQGERLRALQLLATIADSSEDAIFAKDLDGRYTLFNRAASEFVGKPIEAVLGRDDRELFPPEQAEFLMAHARKIVSEDRTLYLE